MTQGWPRRSQAQKHAFLPYGVTPSVIDGTNAALCHCRGVSDDRPSQMMRELEQHLASIEKASGGDLHKQLEGLYLLAVEREELAVVGYGGDVVQARVSRLRLDEPGRMVVSHALRWAARDERSHAVLARGLLARARGPVVWLKTMAADLGGLIAGWSSAVLQHTTLRSAPLSRFVARLITLFGAVAGKVPASAGKALVEGPFADFCDFQVGAERTAAASWEKMSVLMERVSAGALPARTAASIARDERKHERVLATLRDAFDANDSLREGWTSERLVDALRAVDESFVPSKSNAVVGEGGQVRVRESAAASRGDAAALASLLDEVAGPALDALFSTVKHPVVAIKTTFMMAYDARDPSPTVDPALAEALALALRARGAKDVLLLEAGNHYDVSFEGRSVAQVAAYAGFTSPHYTVVDAHHDQVQQTFRRGYAQRSISKAWVHADLRLVLGKVRSNPSWLVHLSCNTVESLGRRLDELLFHDREADSSTALMMVLDAFPPHLSVLDATHHVPGGVTGILGDPSPAHPGRLYAATDPLALDLVVARHMGITRFPRHGAIAAALDWFDDPRPRTTVDGPDTPLPGFVSPHRNDFTVALTALSYPVYLAGRDRGRWWVPKMDSKAFPEKPSSLVDRLIRATLRASFGFGRPS